MKKNDKITYEQVILKCRQILGILFGNQIRVANFVFCLLQILDQNFAGGAALHLGQYTLGKGAVQLVNDAAGLGLPLGPHLVLGNGGVLVWFLQ